MTDIEVENILSEIRERVYAEQQTSELDRLSGVNGRETSRANDELKSDNLARLESYLTTTARAWDRLPPLVSNRSGTTARLELWLKRYFKRATRWYAWEQVNFNAAVHHALRDVVQVLAANEKTIDNLCADSEARQAALQQYESEMRILRLELKTQTAALDAQRLLVDAHKAREVHVDAQLAEIVSELREAVSRLQEQQRVSYKQLALEASEAAVLEDRARRQTQDLLEQLQRRVEQLE